MPPSTGEVVLGYSPLPRGPGGWRVATVGGLILAVLTRPSGRLRSSGLMTFSLICGNRNRVSLRHQGCRGIPRRRQRGLRHLSLEDRLVLVAWSSRSSAPANHSVLGCPAHDTSFPCRDGPAPGRGDPQRRLWTQTSPPSADPPPAVIGPKAILLRTPHSLGYTSFEVSVDFSPDGRTVAAGRMESIPDEGKEEAFGTAATICDVASGPGSSHDSRPDGRVLRSRLLARRQDDRRGHGSRHQALRSRYGPGAGATGRRGRLRLRLPGVLGRWPEDRRSHGDGQRHRWWDTDTGRARDVRRRPILDRCEVWRSRPMASAWLRRPMARSSVIASEAASSDSEPRGGPAGRTVGITSGSLTWPRDRRRPA